MAALAVLAVFTQVGIWVDGDNLGWPFGVWLIVGAVLASALVRRVGLWTVAPAPPVVFLIVAVGNAAWRRQTQWHLMDRSPSDWWSVALMTVSR